MYFLYDNQQSSNLMIFVGSEDLIDVYVKTNPDTIYFQGEIVMTDEGFNIFDGATSEPVREDQIVLVEWKDNSEQVFGPYTYEDARAFGEELQATNDKLHSWTITTLSRP